MIVKNNIILFVLLILAFAFAAGVRFEVSWGNSFYLNEMPYIREVFLVVFLLTMTVFGFKTINRWSGVVIFLRKSKYAFELMAPIDNNGRTRMISYNVLELIIYSVFSLSFIYLTDESFWLGILCGLMAVELIIFSVLFPKVARIGIRKSSMFILTRHAKIIPFDGLEKIEKDFNEWFFHYSSGRIIKINLGHISFHNRPLILEKIKDLNPVVFFSDSLKEDAKIEGYEQLPSSL